MGAEARAKNAHASAPTRRGNTYNSVTHVPGLICYLSPRPHIHHSQNDDLLWGRSFRQTGHELLVGFHHVGDAILPRECRAEETLDGGVEQLGIVERHRGMWVLFGKIASCAFLR